LWRERDPGIENRKGVLGPKRESFSEWTGELKKNDSKEQQITTFTRKKKSRGAWPWQRGEGADKLVSQKRVLDEKRVTPPKGQDKMRDNKCRREDSPRIPFQRKKKGAQLCVAQINIRHGNTTLEGALVGETRGGLKKEHIDPYSGKRVPCGGKRDAVRLSGNNSERQSFVSVRGRRRPLIQSQGLGIRAKG